ncbi:Os03g0805800, partial [Oryza sativa Japonica Group]
WLRRRFIGDGGHGDGCGGDSSEARCDGGRGELDATSARRCGKGKRGEEGKAGDGCSGHSSGARRWLRRRFVGSSTRWLPLRTRCDATRRRPRRTRWRTRCDVAAAVADSMRRDGGRGGLDAT